MMEAVLFSEKILQPEDGGIRFIRITTASPLAFLHVEPEDGGNNFLRNTADSSFAWLTRT
jgi:hypothetical protein